LPFSSGELAQALLARLFPTDDATLPRLQVAPADSGTVAVQVGSRSRVVTLAERTGPGAARVVALVIAELMTIDPEVAEQPEEAEETDEDDASPASRAGTRAEAAKRPAPITIAAPAVQPTEAGTPRRLFVTAGAAKGIGSDELLAATVDADVALASPFGPSWLRLTPSVGLVYTPTHDAGTVREVSFSEGILRALGGGDLGPLDLAAGPFVAGYAIQGVASHTGILFGAEALARWGTPLSLRTRLVIAARVHAYGNRLRVAFSEGGTYATPRLEATLGVGLAWDWPS
jgi:hypothetical protein